MAKKTKQRRVVLEKPLKLKPCPFDKEDAPKIDYKNVQLLKKYLSDKSKIRSRRVTGLCTQHQSDIALAVKNAREIALLPFVSTGR